MNRPALSPAAALACVLALTVFTSDAADWQPPSLVIVLPDAQELVINALKHAGPSAIDVALTRSNGTVVLQVDDDGVGIDTTALGRAVPAGHVGIAMVRRRVEDARGRLDIAPRPEGGTRSTVSLPV